MTMESDAGRNAADNTADTHADAADVQEQQRPVQESEVDPEQVGGEAYPDGTRTDADAADLQEQSIEVPAELGEWEERDLSPEDV